jgi:ABC-type phosphate/phosphonate transport system substrate-binding protein
MFRTLLAGLVLGVAVLACGCAGETFSKSVWDPFHVQPLFLTGAKPVRIGLARSEAQPRDSILNPLTWLPIRRTPWASLERGLSEALRRPVVVEDLEPFQVAAHLRSGRIQFAWLSAADYLELLKDGELGNALALSEGGARRGLIVASAKSDVRSLADIKSRRFAFGPKDDPVLHLGALKTLGTAGVTADDVAKELLPIPGTLQFHISSAEAAKEVVYGLNLGGLSTAAGVIDESEYMSYPETGGRLLPLPTFSKDQFSILARTEPVKIETIPNGPFLAGAEADAKMAAAVRDYLVAAEKKDKTALRDLGVSRFEAAPDGARAQLLKLREMSAGQTATTQPQ